MSGTVTAVNAALAERPEAINTSPHDSWMIVLEVADPGEASQLLDDAKYTELTK
jgi:glycine cleavage system H protein